MRDRYRLVLTFHQTADQLNDSTAKGADLNAEIVRILKICKLLLNEMPAVNQVVTLRYREMEDAYVQAVKAMQRPVDPVELLVAFERAVSCQETYFKV
jgi:hypothetical protein